MIGVIGNGSLHEKGGQYTQESHCFKHAFLNRKQQHRVSLTICSMFVMHTFNTEFFIQVSESLFSSSKSFSLYFCLLGCFPQAFTYSVVLLSSE